MVKVFTYVWGLRGPQPQIWHLERVGAAPIGGGKAIAPLHPIHSHWQNFSINGLAAIYPPPTSEK